MHTQMSCILARAVVDELEQQADVSWKEFLHNNPKGKNREKALKALDKERKSLLKSILTKLDSSHPNYELAKKKATNGRWLLSGKRSASVQMQGGQARVPGGAGGSRWAWVHV